MPETIAVIVIAATILANAAVAAADLARARFVLANSSALSIPESRLPALGVLKALGAVGLLVGLLGPIPIGVAAATGLVLFYLGAVTVHVRARVLYNLAFPGAFLTLAAASLAAFLTAR